MVRLLDSIDSPADLRKLRRSRLPELAAELRELIIDVVSRNRGHLASNLGVVELTLALHYCFDFERDHLVWDCGHQTYAHKIITGRRDRFHTLRQEGGLSGFADPSESPFDTFNFGHTSTSISAGLGLALADAVRGNDARTVAVIGDGAMAGGMAFEALNHAGALGTNLLVVLNDNKMSISHTVGAIAHYLRKLRAGRPFVDIRRELQDFVPRIPVVGEPFDSALGRLRDGIQAAIGPGGPFVELGFHYYGPVDGHHIPELVDAFHDLRRVEGPVLFHVVTEKGHGFPPATEDPTRFHSSKRFEHENGTLSSEEVPSGQSYSAVFGRCMCRLAEEDDRVVAITAAMPDGTGLRQFAERFPDRFYNTGICEQHAVGLADGLSRGGLKPVFAVYSTFLQRAVDQMAHDVALQDAPVTFCIDRAGLVGADGPTHHGLHDIALCRMLPGFVVMAPKDGRELRAMLRLAVRTDAPVAVRYPREVVPDEEGSDAEPGEPELAVGRAEVCREGTEGAIIAYGALVGRALRAATLLAEQDELEVTVVNARFGRPLDRETICATVRDHPAVLVAEDHSVVGGFGAAVLEMLAEEGICTEGVRLAGVPDRFVEHAGRETQLARCGLDAPALADRLRDLMEQRRRG